MRLLLHTCCAPCLIFPLKRLKEKGFLVSGIFYNPNIQGFSEYNSRRQAVQALSEAVRTEVFYPEYRPAEFFQAINLREEAGQRCLICWSLRLEKTARLAREKGFDHFSTTLLVSPYQDHEALKAIGSSVSEEEGVAFYYEDFRPGFREAHNEARSKGIYCQKYCGCIYSEIERKAKTKK